MKRENLKALLDNEAMITEPMLKNNFLNFTGRIRFRKIVRTSFRGVKEEHRNNVGEYSYILSFEIILPHTGERIFYDLFNQKNKLREFVNLKSLEAYLKKMGFLREDSPNLTGEIDCGYDTEKDNET